MQYEFTAGAQRALNEAARWAGPDDRDDVGAPALLLGLLAEPECRSAIILARHGIDTADVRRRWPDLTPRERCTPNPPVIFSPEVRDALAATTRRSSQYTRPLVLATEQVLLGLASAEGDVSDWLHERGIDPDAMEAEMRQIYGYQTGPIALESVSTQASESSHTSDSTHNAPIAHITHSSESVSQPPSTVSDPHPQAIREQVGSLRVLDAAANRAREGLRVVEDFVRFVLDDRHLTAELKQMRHALAGALGRIPIEQRLASRETQADVGTALTTAAEEERQDTAAVVTANFLRLQEGLRTLEEMGKLHSTQVAACAKQLRYRAYTLERAIQTTGTSRNRLAGARLYVLIDGRSSNEQFDALARSLIAVGVHVIQLRGKRLDDRRLLGLARRLRGLTAGSRTLFVMNDRPDLAALARADGVHVGQEELTVKDARAIVGPEALIGVSTHSIDQAKQAVLDGANYIGVGPTFPSSTKTFEAFPGVELLRAVAADIRLPAFAIGGITRENLPQVLDAGLRRIAVGAAVTEDADPAAAARELLAMLHTLQGE
jgi:thiamine-phosphate pyrophosphorylase